MCYSPQKQGDNMNKFLILALALFSTLAFADRTTNAMRTPSGQLVSLGDSESSLIDKMGRPKPRFYVLNDGRLYCAATEYKYDIDLQQYTVILCQGKVVKILWENK